MAFTIILACLLILSISYITITRRVIPGLIRPDDKRSTPARRYMDGKETLPVPSPLLTVFQFQSITIDPVISPVIALQFGWLPALLWIIIGTIAIGWLQSYLVAIISIRTGGSSLINLFGSLITRPTSKLIALLLSLMLFPLIGHLASLVSILVNRTSTIPAVFFIYIISLLAGQLIFRSRLNSLLSVIICILLVFAALSSSAAEIFAEEVTEINSIVGGDGTVLFARILGGGEITFQTAFWTMLVIAITSAAAALPVWKLTIPFNFFTGCYALTLVILTVLGIGIGHFNGTLDRGFEIPALTGLSRSDTGPIWPVMFMLVTSGTISGWHALVASHSTSRMVEKETRLLPVSIGAQLIGAFLVILMFVLGATFGVSSGSLEPNQGYRLIAGPASAVAFGLQKIFELIGIPSFFSDKAGLFLLTFVYLSALQLAVRYSRQLLTWALGDNFPVLRNPLSAIFLIACLTYILILLGLWQWLWPLVAGTALVISGFVLITCANWLAGQGRRVPCLIWSGRFLVITGSAGVLYESFYQAVFKNLLPVLDQNPGAMIGNIITLVGGGVILASTGMLGREIIRNFRRH